MSADAKPRRRIVSSARLAASAAPELSEFEFALNLVNNAFQRWMVRCAQAAGQHDLGPLDVQVLHLANAPGREKRLADFCFLLNVEDTHLASYALKKLIRAGLVGGEKRGKEMFYTSTRAGDAICESYRQVREQCLIETVESLGIEIAEMSDLARRLRALSGLYDQAARSATTL